LHGSEPSTDSPFPSAEVALLHGSGESTGPPSPKLGSPHSVAVRHPEQRHRIEGLDRQLHLNALPSEGSTSHTSTNDRLVPADGVLNQAPPTVA
jgi:hypothetical protein